MKRLAAALALTLCASLASAEYWTGNILHESLKDKGSPARIAAIGYILGVHDAHEGGNICTPDEVKSGQLADLVEKFLESFPEHRHHSADRIILTVLKAAWPCDAKKKPSNPRDTL